LVIQTISDDISKNTTPNKLSQQKNRSPFKLLYYEAYNLLEDALSRKEDFKTGFGRAYLKRRLSDI